MRDVRARLVDEQARTASEVAAFETLKAWAAADAESWNAPAVHNHQAQVAAIEGAPSLAECDAMELVNLGFDSLADCDVESRCPIRSPLHRIQEDIWRQFARTTLKELASPDFTLIPNKKVVSPTLSASA